VGVSISGFMQSDFRFDTEIFNNVYHHLEEVDKEFSKVLGVNCSRKLTTVKPSGTVSLLPGVTPGAHPAFSKYYIRRVRIAADDPAVVVCRKHNYPVEPELRLDGSKNLDTMVISFPIESPSEAICANEINAVAQLDNILWLQHYWADNSVSCTVYYEQDELPDIRRWLQLNFEQVKSLSFLLKSEHGFQQAPMEAITKDEYATMVAKCKPITSFIDVAELELNDSLECEGGHCPIR